MAGESESESESESCSKELVTASRDVVVLKLDFDLTKGPVGVPHEKRNEITNHKLCLFFQQCAWRENVY